jgi:hypothetical protein
MDHYGECPQCGANWDAGSIFDAMRRAGYTESDKKLWELITQCYAPPYRFSRLVGIEYSRLYDGVWEWACPDCNARFPRFVRKKDATTDDQRSGV